MPQSVPTPVAAALGLVPTVLGGVRRLPGKALSLPLLAVGSALSGLDAARREYDDLARRGERLIAQLRGASFDELEDRVEDSLQGTPLARPYDALEDALEDAGEAVTGTVSSLAGRVGRTGRVAQRTVEQAADVAEDAAEDAVETAADAAETVVGTAAGAAEQAVDATAELAQETTGVAAETARKAAKKAVRKAGKGRPGPAQRTSAPAEAEESVPEAEQPKGEPTPAATQPDSTRISTAAAPEVVDTVERVSAQASAPAVVDHDDLPLADYDHMTLGSLRGRLRSLTVEQLVQVRDYEKAHADRLPVVTMLDNRIAKLAAAPAAEQPSGRPSDRPAPGQGATAAGSPVTPATGGPALNPPSQGDPTNPSQPRTTGSPGTNPDSSA